MRRVELPLDDKRVRELKVGDIVYFDGKLFTGRESFYIRAKEEIVYPTLDYNSVNLMMHVGPVMEEKGGKWKPVSLTPTTSIRMEKYAHHFIRKFCTRAIIGKGTMGEKTMNAMAETGCIHLCGIGINANILAKQVKEVVSVCFLDEIGPTEATWVLEVENFGPFVVDIDTDKNNLFSSINKDSQKKLKDIYLKHDIPINYEFTMI